MIKAKYTLGDKSITIEFETIEQLLEYERAQKDESYQSLPESFDKDAFHKKVDVVKASRAHEHKRGGLSPTMSAQIERLKLKAAAISDDISDKTELRTKESLLEYLIECIREIKL